MSDGLVAGKRIVVTGASRGLGRAFATALAREGAHGGIDVLINNVGLVRDPQEIYNAVRRV